MQVVKLGEVEEEITVTLPTSIVEALHLAANDEITIEVTGNCIVLTRTAADFQDAWKAYQKTEAHYHNANRKLAE